MKVSLRWIFDHIKESMNNIDVSALVDTFIRTTAEIEGWRKVSCDLKNLTLAKVTQIDDSSITLESPEYQKKYIITKRPDVSLGSWFLLSKVSENGQWASSIDFGAQKDMLLPAIDCPASLRSGDWKQEIEVEDYIIDVDNKSINSRPDLWGHRGLAREIAAILQLSLRPLEELMVQKNSIAYPKSSSISGHNSFVITIESSMACSRFATLLIPECEPQASSLAMAIRLSRLDSRVINLLVDATNYVMLDLSQPMHAFDATKLSVQNITVRFASDKEKVALLDGETIELNTQDLVIANNNTPISLAGIMGGATTAISHTTKSVLLEAAHFEPATIRRSSARHKKRTESSMRFEKSLDPHQNIDALKRYLFLLNQTNCVYKANDSIVSLGALPEPKIITIPHAFIESKLGIVIPSEKVITILKKLFFGVEQSVENSTTIYTITVPTFRATKDVKIPEDIVEEVGRFIGYDTIVRVMPALQLQPKDLHNTNTVRTIKQFLSYGLMMRELYSYSFFDEELLRDFNWTPINYVPIKNPISENFTRLVTTLQPSLLKAVADNSITHTKLRFFEWARVWHMDKDVIVEQKSLSGIFFEQQAKLDFYAGKEFLDRMFDMLGLSVTWQIQQENNVAWLNSHKTALIVHDDKIIGTAGMIDQDFLVSKLSAAGGSAFIFEINADYILRYKKPLSMFKSISKYPAVYRDVSVLINVSKQVTDIIDKIKTIDKRIEFVDLIDFFSKPEWKDQKALTFRIEISDKEKTLHSDEIETIWNKVIQQLQQDGAQIR